MEENPFKTLTNNKREIDAYLFDHPNVCPYCHRHIIPIYVSDYRGINQYHIYVTLVCPNSQCDTPFIARYDNDPSSNVEEFFYYEKLTSYKLKNENFSVDIKSISPMFCQIYNEAFFAEQNNLLEICGVGFRKSLEFLIKDYLITLFPDKDTQIKKNTISYCINTFVEDTRIKSSANRAIWLGNDHTHYEKKWSDKDLTDLKTLIKLTINWIELEVTTKKFHDTMQ